MIHTTYKQHRREEKIFFIKHPAIKGCIVERKTHGI
jgi:hypothetical protein